MKLNKPLCFSLVVVLCSVAFSVAGQNKELILDTEPETIIELIGAVVIDSSGNLRATPQNPEICAESGATCDGVDVSVLSFTGNNVDGTLTVTQGSNVRFRWDSRGAWECEGAGFPDWNGTGKPARNTSGQVVSTNNISPGTYTAALTCRNGPPTDTASFSIVVEEDGGGTQSPSGCEERQPPAGWTRSTSCIYNTSADCSSFADVWSPWPGTTNTRNFFLDTSNNGKRYVAMQFNSGNVAADKQGQISYNVPQFGSNIDAGTVMISISSCPGDFHHAEIFDEMGPGCTQHNTSNLQQNFRWGGSDAISEQFRCGLEPNKTYYFNMLYADPSTSLGTDPDEFIPWPPCQGSPCGHNITP